MSTDTLNMHIDGRRVPAASGTYFEVENPATGACVARVAHGAGADVEAAVAAATAAQPSWGAMPALERAIVLERFAGLLRGRLDELAALEVAQIGRPIREMRAQLARLPEWYEYFAAVARTHEGRVHPFGGDHVNYTQRRAIGVVGLITPWNHPMLILTKKLAPALAAGNAVVVKPSELAPVTTLLLAELLEEAGLPAGVCNVVTGFGAEAGKALTTHASLAKVDVTGGTETGRLIGAAAGHNLAGFAAELGGKASVLIFDDMELDRAVSGALFASFIASGQTCVQGARLLVQRSCYEAFVAALVSRANALKVGDPTDTATQMGPLVSARQRDMIEGYVAAGVDEGARLAAGGQRVTDGACADGYYLQPTVFADVKNGMRIDQEEIFGPIACVLPFDDEDHAVEVANATEFGLAGSVWTHDLGRAHRVAHALEMGIVWINDHHRIDPSSPWGGFKSSGLGNENGIVTYEAYTKIQSVIVNTSANAFDWFDPAVTDQRYS